MLLKPDVVMSRALLANRLVGRLHDCLYSLFGNVFGGIAEPEDVSPDPA